MKALQLETFLTILFAITFLTFLFYKPFFLFFFPLMLFLRVALQQSKINHTAIVKKKYDNALEMMQIQ